MILGAGASAPYGFSTGGGLLNEARRCSVGQLAGYIPQEFRAAAPALHSALRGTLTQSIDALLETRLDLVDAGKCYMARWLLQYEKNMLDRHVDNDPNRAQH